MCEEDFIPLSLPASVIHPLLFSVDWKFNGSLWAVHVIEISFNLRGTDRGWEPHSKKERHKSYFLTCGRGRTKNFQTPDKSETTISPGPNDDNKNTDQANIFINLTFEVFQKQAFFV